MKTSYWISILVGASFLIQSAPIHSATRTQSLKRTTKSQKVLSKKSVDRQTLLKRKRQKEMERQAPPSQSNSSSSAGHTRADSALQRALRLVQENRPQEASILLYRLSTNPSFEKERTQIKYILGLTLFDLQLYQTAAFQFFDVVRQGKNQYVKKSLEKLSIAASELENETLLNYAITQIEPESFPKNHLDLYYFRLGEIYLRKGKKQEAVNQFVKIQPRSAWFAKARYLQAMALAEAGQVDQSLRVFADIVKSRTSKDVTDSVRNSGMLGLARAFYQKKNWDAALDAYRQIPRDTEAWHEAIFESSWAALQNAQFRTVLGQLHSLHSPYYEDAYQPESILLRSIVYLYICQYDEMEKTLDFFEKTYRPVQNRLRQFLTNKNATMSYFDEVYKLASNYDSMKKDRKNRKDLALPYMVLRNVYREGDVQVALSSLGKLQKEKTALDQMSTNWRESAIGQFGRRVVSTRMEATRKVIGRLTENHLRRMSKDLEQHFEQHGFAKYEMLKGRKEGLKKVIAEKGIEKVQVDADADRQFYVKNGYEYYPFGGEYWRDEIGNYHYLGVESCE